ncbi:hypothetical protein EX895_001474 [Sporisorium graminicola]|uniref:DUF885 domain-containing protein n=1 Tax=Sporisorium graminicola TaxID=280036 RepID=A0A4V6EUH6_9BASI|nr:hypothetical protein EX895_001474 [Sporisorium graminicola]TKY89689.1 hypothetical protein EX895_001474 [Sporisorium graminicola]
MQIISASRRTTVPIIAFCLLSISAAPIPVRYGSLTSDRPETADWWQIYEQTHFPRQPPAAPVVYARPTRELVQALEPFRERLVQLEYLKRRVLANSEASRYLTPMQRSTLTQPFHKWDHQALTDTVDRFNIFQRLNEEKAFVAQVESVLYGVAKHLPDVSLR